MHGHLARLVASLQAAHDRRAGAGDETGRLDAVLSVLAAEHPPGPAPDGADERLDDLAQVFGLSDLDVDLLVVGCAPDLDPNLSSALALLQADPARTRAGAALALELCGAPLLSGPARARLGPGGPLLRHDLLRLPGGDLFLQRSLEVPDRVVGHLLGDDTPDALVEALAVQLVRVDLPEAAPLSRALAAGEPLTWVRGRAGSLALSLAVAALDALDVPHLAVDLRRCPSEDLGRAVVAALREAGLRRAGLVVAGAERLADTPAHLAVLERGAVPVVAVSTRGWDPSWLPRLPFALDAPSGTSPVREALWRAWRDTGPEEDGWRDLVSLRLTPEEILQTSRHASTTAAVQQTEPSVALARQSARRLSAELAGSRAITTPPGFADLVLPPTVLATLHEVVDWARGRDTVLAQGVAGKGDAARGIAALFTGSPGTGKTLAAQVVAGELGLDLHTVDLSAVVSKYIGETEKNLERVFSEAESLNVLLFFDEADALFGTRSEVKDARDRYANQEVAYLLQRMERFDGVAVLATNLSGNLDAAFARRLHFVVHFPDPDARTRRHLWEAHLRPLQPTDPDDPVDLDHLADAVEVAGGEVRNIVLAAAYSAAAEHCRVGMRHLLVAVVREYRKMGRLVPVPGLRDVPVPHPAAAAGRSTAEAGASRA